MRSEKEVRKEFEELETKLMNSAKEYFKSKKQKESFSKYKTFFKLWDRYGGDEPLTYFSSDDGFGEDIGEYFALNWVLEGKPRYSVDEFEKIWNFLKTTSNYKMSYGGSEFNEIYIDLFKILKDKKKVKKVLK